ncbi:MAG: DNA polymerase III subunit epsilon [Alphaproteobacteria bacterium]|nr:DNA polymerase III subunit epsilon [Alphaproteobacteria bacterium]
MTRQIVLDTETTGLSFAAGHRIVEIGCVELKNLLPTGRTFQTYLNPKRPMDPGAMKVSGITDESLIGKPEFYQVADNFLSFIEDSDLVIHNAPFDMGFLNGELTKFGYPAIPMTRAIDTVVMARTKFPGSPANLDALCRRFEIDLSARTKHGALLDAQLLAEVYLQLCGGRQQDLDLNGQSTTMVQENTETIRTFRPMRDFQLSSEEVEKHEAFVAKIKNSLWDRAAS